MGADMAPGQWQKVKEVFQSAIEIPRAARAAFVAQACAGDEALRCEVESLLTSEEASEDFLDETASGYVPGLAEQESQDSEIGRRIGAYRITGEIGEGGMGAVYLAERVDDFQQKAAIKLMRRGMDSRMVVSRFRHERQILAGLDHPNIARLLDGGATGDGQPYFVMAYVEGVAIDTYCDQQALSIPDRLKLFREVCAAVQYAHQNLVVHRDIKPGNILVTAEGSPKLLDFGIAKLLRHEPNIETAALTQADTRLMTPEYASPEQVRGLPVTTATDVYSLGVVLYQLLAGRMPYGFESRSATEIERVICEQDPQRPSAVAQADREKGLAGDLDTIVLKALEKDALRRYSSVEQFGEDIRRHLEGLPILARPQTWRYRAAKFARRNRTGVIAATLAVVSLIGGLIATTWEAHVARQERARAERQFTGLRHLTNSFLFDFHDKIKDLPGATEARRMVVAKALEYLGQLAAEAKGNTGLELELAEGYVRLGDVQGNPYLSDLGDVAGALASYERGLQIAQSVAAREPGNPEAMRAVARAWQERGDVLPLLGKEADAVASERKAVEGFQALVAAHPENIAGRMDLARGQEALGDALGHPGIASLGDVKGAAEAYRASLATWQAILGRDPKNPRGPRALASITLKLGNLELAKERLEAAKAFYTKALEHIRKSDLDNTENLRVAASVRRKLAYVLSYKDVPGALAQYRECSEADERLVAADPKDRRARMDLAVVLRDAGELQEGLPDAAAATASYRKVLEQLLMLDAGNPGNLMRKEQMADMYLRLGRLLKGKAEGRKMTLQSLEMMKSIADRQGAKADQLAEYADELLRAEPVELRNPGEALRYAQLASSGADERNPTYLDLVAKALYQLGRRAEAIATAQKALGLLPADSAGREQLQRHIAEYRGGAGK